MKKNFATCLSLVMVFFMAGISFGDVLLDEFDGSTSGTPFGITYTDTPYGKGSVFNRQSESRIQYPLNTVIPTQGTLEWLIKVDSGYNYNNYQLNDGLTEALIFTTDIWSGDVTWTGSMWLRVFNNGDIRFHIAGEKYEAGWDMKYVLDAKNTSFRFGEWHSIGISYGSDGRYIMLNGHLVAGNAVQTQQLGAGGNHSTPKDIPTIGESVSGFWGNNQWEGGFNGVVDRFRASTIQKDWVISGHSQSQCGLKGDINDDGKISLEEAINALQTVSGIVK